MDKVRLAAHRTRVTDYLSRRLPAPEGPDDRLPEAMAYAWEGGKAIRAALTMASCDICDVPEPAAVAAASGIEAMHAYSLVHDDLPAMDDDAMRRGRPTVHVAYGEMLAILVGDALQALAYEIVAGIEDADPDRVRLLVAELARAAGPAGMVGGQYLDLLAERQGGGTEAEGLRRVETIQQRKTGALIRWACEAGPILGGKDRAPFRAYADAVGLAFQIQDDLLDVEGTAEETGKAVGKDAGRGKATFVDLLGVDGARGKAAALVTEAEEAVSPLGPRAGVMRDLARFIVTRRS